MFSYIVAIFAALIFLSDPIARYFYPDMGNSSSSSVTSSSNIRPLSPRPRLNEDLLAIDAANASDPSCPEDSYIAHVLNRAPLVVYLENFLSEDERDYLLETSGPLFEPSMVGSQDQEHDTSIRNSHVAVLPRTDPVRCIERRAMAVQGWRRDAFIERLRTQRYDAPAGHYAHHFDWNVHRGGWGRVSSFMVWVDDRTPGKPDLALEGGGTEFPRLPRRWDGDRWCSFIECPDANSDGGNVTHTPIGATFKVKPGNAVYWENFTPDGRGFDETWHAGLPVTSGTKVGLNIWTFGRIE